MNQSRRGRGGTRAGNNPELAQVVIAGSSQCSYALSKRQFLVQDDPKVPDRGGEDKGIHRNSAERDSESSLSSWWWVPNQIYWVLCGFSSKRLDGRHPGIESIGDLGHSSDCRSCPRCWAMFVGLNVIGIRMTFERTRCKKKANICSKRNIEKRDGCASF